MKSIKITFEVKTSFDISIEDAIKELIEAEQRMNCVGKLRYHLQDLTLLHIKELSNYVSKLPDEKV